MPNPSPTVRRRSLSAELRRLRTEAKLTAEYVDSALEQSKGVTAWIERNKWLRPNARDISAMLDLYGVTDTRRREELLTWARQGKERGWWHPYSKMLSEAYTTFIGLEYGASTLRTFELAVIPGLLQTPDYARAHMQRWPGELDLAEIDQRVQIRMERQQILHCDDPTRLRAVIDEAALRRIAGSPEIMQAQMRHLIEMAELPRVEIQVIPFESGTHAGTQGPFTILEFGDGDDVVDLPAIYTENIAGELFIEQPEEVGRFRRAFDGLIASALSPADTIEMVSQIAKTLA